MAWSLNDKSPLEHLEQHSGHDTFNTETTSRPAAGAGRKQPRSGDESQMGKSSRRRMACQSCRVRKVKCDGLRPSCGFCVSAGNQCVYLDNPDQKGRLDPAAALLMRRLDEILERVDGIEAAVRPRRISMHPAEHFLDSGPDHMRIPTCNSTADSVLTWPIFQGRFPPDYLIDILLEPGSHKPEHCGGGDSIVVPGGIEPLADERIPALIDKFLEDVHTKNPILDVEALIRYGRKAATSGLSWDAPSCLVLMACALGSISCPFRVSEVNERSMEMNAPGMTSSTFFAKEIQQAESCYALACRRLGLLKQTILGAQCYFYSAVYLMYTLRPLPAWNHFCQASTFYQIHSRTIARPSHRTILDTHMTGMTMTQRRLEQSLYWSCFKSECEMRIELPLPQSTIADVDYPHMFPSPPSHPTEGIGLRQYDGDTLSFAWDTLQPSNKVMNEEKSWYYYLTEVALRRISNRILNTFYRQDHTSWLHIQPLIPIAKEFEEQILVWSSNLPPAMQYDRHSTGDASPSRELSWATWNRLLEMKAWLYQPFLYHAIHSHISSPSASSTATQDPILHSLVNAAMECNLSTIEHRTLRHRHHGLWFDLRAIVTASFIVIAAVKSGSVEVEREWEERIKGVCETLKFWEGEGEELAKTREVLEGLVGETWGRGD